MAISNKTRLALHGHGVIGKRRAAAILSGGVGVPAASIATNHASLGLGALVTADLR